LVLNGAFDTDAYKVKKQRQWQNCKLQLINNTKNITSSPWAVKLS